MPRLTSRFCRGAGCREYVKPPDTHCPKCKAIYNQQAKKDAWKKKKRDPRYTTTRWKDLSKWLIRQHIWCAICLLQGKHTAAVVTDHIMPISKDGAFWDDRNLQVLCRDCHSWKTGQDRRKEPKLWLYDSAGPHIELPKGLSAKDAGEISE